MDQWKSIRLELGSTQSFPGGSVSRGYLVCLPLDEHGMVDREAFRRHPQRAKVRRYWSTDPDEFGDVVERNGDWTLRCNGDPSRALRLDGRPVRTGGQVSVVESDGTILPFDIASVR